MTIPAHWHTNEYLHIPTDTYNKGTHQQVWKIFESKTCAYLIERKALVHRNRDIQADTYKYIHIPKNPTYTYMDQPAKKL